MYRPEPQPGQYRSSNGHEFRDNQIVGGKHVLGNIYHYHPSPESPLSLLPFAKDTPFNSFDRQQEPNCLRDTRVDLLQVIYDWADGQDERCIFWLNGLAGNGKSTIARTIASRYHEERLAASFFFSRGGGDVSHAGKFFTSIAVQLACNIPSLRQHISDAVTERGDIANLSLRDQWHQLILRPVSKLEGSSSPSSYVLVVDALDECTNEDRIRIILQLLAEVRTLKTIRLRFFLTSRPEILIQRGFHQMLDARHQDFVLHKISPPLVDHDIAIFLKHNLRQIGEDFGLEAGWPGDDAIKNLVSSASGLFIWVVTICRFIREGGRFAPKRLDTILKGSSGSALQHQRSTSTRYILPSLRTLFPLTIQKKRRKSYLLC